MKSAVYFLFIGICFFACRSEADQYLELRGYVRYIEPERSIRGQFTIKSGADSSQLQPDTMRRKLTFQNQVLDRKQYLQGYRYQMDESVQVPDQLFVELENGRDTIGGRFDFKTITVGAVNFAETESKDLLIEWKGLALGQDEQLICIANDAQNHTVTFQVNESKSNAFSIPNQTVKELEPGKGKLYLIRKGKVVEQDSRHAFYLETEYYSAEFQFEIP